MAATLVWITGASAGLGAALATAAPTGARVIDISRSGGTEGTEHFRADLADPASWPVVAGHVRDELGAFTGDRVAFVHNAGTIEPIGFAGEVDDEAYTTNVLLNSAAPQVLGHGFLRALTEVGFEGRADLVMLSSGAARDPYPGWSSYSAGKAAIDAWVTATGQEQALRGNRCRVISLAPGVVATGMQETIRRTSERDFPRVGKFVDLHDSGRLRDRHEVARELWAALDRDLDNGALVDLRTLAGS
jgi:benzil reductase ((S)-benzoin forming)